MISSILHTSQLSGIHHCRKQNVCAVPVADVPIIRELFLWDTDNPEFKKRLSDLVFRLTYNKDGKPYQTKKKKE